jgi:hypothetical protein
MNMTAVNRDAHRSINPFRWIAERVPFAWGQVAAKDCMLQTLERGGLVLVFGSTGAGKSSSVLLPLIRLSAGRRVAVLDGKGGLLEHTLEWGMMPPVNCLSVHTALAAGSVMEAIMTDAEQPEPRAGFGLTIVDDVDELIEAKGFKVRDFSLAEFASRTKERGGTIAIGSQAFTWPAELTREALAAAQTLWIGKHLASNVLPLVADELGITPAELIDKLDSMRAKRPANAMLFATRSDDGWSLQATQASPLHAR